jgi:hypothetical protein
MQHVGVNILQLIEAIASSSQLSQEGSQNVKPSVYYDILGTYSFL